MINHIDPIETYRAAIQLREGELNRLFQRVSFFLIGTAFLIAAFVALITSNRFLQSSALPLFAVLLTLVGLGLSVLFTVSNYLNDRIIRIMTEYIINLEKDDLDNHLVMSSLYHQVDSDNLPCKQFIRAFFRDFYNALRRPTIASNPTNQNRRSVASHTWLIPFGFILFWLVAIAVIPFISGCYPAGPIIIGLEVLALVCIVINALPEKTAK